MNYILGFLKNGSERSIKIKKNIFLSTLLKSGNILISFLIVRLTYSYLDSEKYGVWVTILSILAWVNLFDIGVGNGLRNKLAEALAKFDIRDGKMYTSTSYAIIGLIMVAACVPVVLIAKGLDFSVVFNINAVLANEVNSIMTWMLIFYFLTFSFSLITSISFASQDSAISDLIRLSTSFLIYLMLLLISIRRDNSIFLIGIIYSAITFFIMFIANIVLFSKRYKNICPSLKYINFKYAKNVVSLGAGFFILQITSVIIFTTDNLIITQIFGPEEVAPYQIVYKLFSIFILVFGIVLGPLWSGFTDAYSKGDIGWIKKILKRMMFLMLPLSIGIILTMTYARQIIQLWLGKPIEISGLLIFLMGIYTFMFCWTSLFTQLINGIGKIKIQVLVASIGAILNLPLSVYFAKNLGMGISGVILATMVSILIGTIAITIQAYRIIKNYDFRRAFEGD